MFGSINDGYDTTKEPLELPQSTPPGDEAVAMCTEACGRPEPPDERELIEAFGSTTRIVFAFLSSDHALQPSEVITYAVGESSRRAVAPDQVVYPFLAVVEFTGENRPIRLSYGRSGYDLELEIGANGSGFHPIDSWLDALGVQHEPANDTGVATTAALERHAGRLAAVLQQHYPAIATAAQAVVDRLPSLGAKTAPRLNRTRERAHAAFADGDYASYVELLAPFEAALTVTERRKLEFARSRG